MSARPILRSLPLVSAVILTVLSLPAFATARVNPTVKFVLEDGAKVSDIASVTIKASTTDDGGIDKVEFYIDDQLKGADSSTPYEFEWNTLEGTEGAHALKAVAFDAKGNTTTAKINVTVDNELGKGAEAHAQAASAALKEGNVDLAANLARRALKIDPMNLAAARAYSGVLRQRGQVAEAVAVLDKATIPDSDIPTREALVALHMAAADASNSTESFLQEANASIEIYKKLSALRVAAAGTDPVAKGDALVAARNYPAAIAAYEKCGPSDTAPVACANRRVLALILAGQIRDAESNIRTITRAKNADASTKALVGFIALNRHDFKTARDTVQQGVEESNVASLIVAAYSDYAMKQVAKAREEAGKAFMLAPDSADVQLVRAFVSADDAVSHRAYVRALELNPMLAEAYALRAYEVMGTGDPGRFQTADLLLEQATKLDPKSAYVQMGRGLSYVGQKRGNEAEPFLGAVLDADKTAADVHVAEALNLSMLDKTLRINDHLSAALKLDPENWADTLVPKTADLITRVNRYRNPPVLLPSSLGK
jgi:tetratricopeptide (TPR) repeat protein